MIVDSPLITDLALGVDRSMPQEGDNQLLLPSTVLATIPLTRPLNNTVPADTSFDSIMRDNLRTNNNQAASSDVIIRLVPGYWELQYYLAVMADFNQALTVADLGVRIAFSYQGTTHTILQVFINTVAQTVGGASRVLLRGPGNSLLLHNVQITGVAENVLSRAWVNAIRLL